MERIRYKVLKIHVRNKKRWNGEGFNIFRPTPLSNPFRIDDMHNREYVIQMYALRLIDRIKANDPEIMDALNDILTHIFDTGECNLICYCAPKQCHGDVIAQVLLNKIHTDKWLTKDDKIGIYGK